MKKITLLLMLMTIMITSSFAAFVEIGSSTSASQPFVSTHLHSWINYVLPSEQIGEAMSINEIQFQVADSPVNVVKENQLVYMKLTTDSEVVANYPDPTNSGFTLVYNGTATWDNSGWQGIVLDSDFIYDGVSNLQIVWENRSGGMPIGTPKLYYTVGTPNTLAWKYGGAFPTVDGSRYPFIPNTKLGYEVADAPEFPVIVSPLNNSLRNELNTELVWTVGDNIEFVQLYFSENRADVENSVETALYVDGELVTSYLPQLENATTYYWKVVAGNSASDFMSSTLVHSFTTVYGIAEAPYFEGFEEPTIEGFPLGWTIHHESTSSTSKVDVYDNTIYSYEGRKALRLENHNDDTGTYMAVLPQIENLDHRLTFYARGFSNTDTQLTVGYLTNVNDPETFVELRNIELTNTFQEYSIRLEDSRTIRYLAFKHANVAKYKTIYIDNVSVKQIPADETAPATLLSPVEGAIDIATSVQLTWRNGVNTAGVNLYLSENLAEVENSATTALVLNNVDATSYQANLNVWANYYWRIGSLNVDGTEVLSDISYFTTVMPQDVVQIGDGTGTKREFPIDTLYEYSYTQTIYPQIDINRAGNIETIAWHYNGHSAIGPDDVKIYMGHTSRVDFGPSWGEEAPAWISLEELTLVYDGTLSFPAIDGWASFALDIPFNYNNIDNLVIAVDENSPGDYGHGKQFYITNSSIYPSINYGSDSINPDPANPPIVDIVNGGTSQYYPNIVLVMQDGDAPVEVYPAPRNLTADVTGVDVELNWEAPAEVANSANLTGYTLYRNNVQLAQVASNVTSYSDEGLAYATYAYKVVANYNAVDSVPTSIVTIAIVEVPVNVAITGTDAVELTWDAATNAISYVIYGTDIPYDLEQDWVIVGTVSGTSYTYTGTENMKFFKVKALSE